MRTHMCGELRAANVGDTVSVCGWVGRRREHGEHLAFVDLRDHSGIVQCVINDDVDVRSEYVIRVTGVVRDRPEGTINDSLPTGQVEIGECEVEILRQADTAAVPDRRPRRRRRRERPSAAPLPRPATRADAEEPADPFDGQRCDACRDGASGIRRGRDADARAVDAGRRP